MSIVSNNIKYLRRLNGLTQEQFARKIGIKRSLLGAYEEARANPNLTNLKNMALAFGVSVDNLLKNDLRKIRDTPELGLPLPPVHQTPPPPPPPPPLLHEPAAPQLLSAILDKYQRPRPTLRMVSRQVALKPVHTGGSTYQRESVYTAKSGFQPPQFNNQYDGASNGVGSKHDDHQLSHQSIQWVKSSTVADYLHNYQNPSFLNRLPTFQLPNLPSGNYRAFEAGDDFAFPGALLVGSFVRNWYEIKDGTNYVFILRNQGIVYRRAYNQVKIKGILLLSSDIASVPSTEISIKDVLEVWEVKAFVSLGLPEPAPSVDRIRELVDELRHELDRNASF
ncbi:helix-turn-helix transcriptional regulator [Telluribacter sp. SYSU D00476]|uniref:helix-turn-helix transcriptional regulator n=1 Tax=Telluribacter sp. SYSU D00476 TaxID=2811430 RepID=UPI001FF520FD|nr:helix-turn-helix transcriptional regulator [Telluribacter sp. SYSU D00476]